MSIHHRYFPGLDGLRGIAAICVLIQHTGSFLGLFGINPGSISRFILSDHEAVLLFFVLSGFLITYRLLEEQHQMNTIHLNNFYRGRLLRIAPLQILIVGISFIMFFMFYGLIPSYHEPVHPLSTFLLLIFFPNIAGLFDNIVNCASHIWSLGVENEFYLIWPFLLIRFKKSIMGMMISVIFVKLVFTLIILPFFISHVFSSSSIISLVHTHLFPIESMAIGGLGAWLMFNQKNTLLNIIFNPISQFLTYSSIIWLIYRNALGISPYIESFIVPFIFLSLILNVSCNPRSLFKYHNRLFNYLGKISYGIYMFHPAVIFLTLWFTHEHFSSKSVALIYLICISLTIAISGLSYKYFEAPIMRFKHKKVSNEAPSSTVFPIVN